MITARWTAPCEIFIEGHAGYAEKGHDIVCAGISTIWGTLIAELDERQRRGEGELSVEDGRITFRPKACRREIQRVYAMMWRGILLLAASYGGYIDAERTW